MRSVDYSKSQGVSKKMCLLCVILVNWPYIFLEKIFFDISLSQTCNLPLFSQIVINDVYFRDSNEKSQEVSS